MGDGGEQRRRPSLDGRACAAGKRASERDPQPAPAQHQQDRQRYPVTELEPDEAEYHNASGDGETKRHALAQPRRADARCSFQRVPRLTQGAWRQLLVRRCYPGERARSSQP